MANTPFRNIRHAISYYNYSKPARYKAPTFGDFKVSGTTKDLDFTGRGPNDLWASIASCIGKVLNRYSGDEQFAWNTRNLGDRTQQLSIEEISSTINRKPSDIRRSIKVIDADITRELRRRELIPKASILSKLDFIAGWDARKEIEAEMEEASQGKGPDETLILITDVDLERAWQRYQERQKEMAGE